MFSALWLLAFALFVVPPVQIGYDRINLIKMAVLRTEKTHKPLLILGKPSNTFHKSILEWNGPDLNKNQTSDDVLSFLSKNEYNNSHVVYVSDINIALGYVTGNNSFLLNQKNNSWVIYIYNVLEYVTGIDNTIFQLERVGGDNLFIVSYQSHVKRLNQYLFGNNQVKQLIFEAPPNNKKIKYGSIF